MPDFNPDLPPASESGEQAVCPTCGSDDWRFIDMPERRFVNESEHGPRCPDPFHSTSNPPASESGERWEAYRNDGTGYLDSDVEARSLPGCSVGWTKIAVVPESRALEAEQAKDEVYARAVEWHERALKAEGELDHERRLWKGTVGLEQDRAEQAEQSLSRAEAILRKAAEYPCDNNDTGDEPECDELLVSRCPACASRSYFTSPIADSARSEPSAGELSVSHTPDNCDPQSCLASERESDG